MLHHYVCTALFCLLKLLENAVLDSNKSHIVKHCITCYSMLLVCTEIMDLFSVFSYLASNE
jgi:hypothetical protein